MTFLISGTTLSMQAQADKEIKRVRVPGKKAGATTSSKGKKASPTRKSNSKQANTIKKSSVKIKFGGLDWGMGGLDNLPSEWSNLTVSPWKSSHLTVHTLRLSAPLANQLELKASAAFDFNNYRFAESITLIPDSEALTVENTGENYKKNCLKTTYLSLPVTLNYKYNNGNRPAVRVGAGVYGSFLLGSKLKQKVGGEKEITKGDFNLNSTRYGVIGKIGYGGLNLYGKYDLSSFFKENEGPQTQAFSVGISIIP